MKGVLFAGGSIIDYSTAEEAAKDADFVVCADSGILHAEKIGVIPDVWVGDLDSVDDRHKCVEFVKLPTEKDDTDTMSAARIMVKNGINCVRMFGCTGTRLDHTYANLFVLKYLLDNGVKAIVEDEHNKVVLLPFGKHTVKTEQGCFLSLLPFCCEIKGLTISGVKYPLNNYTLCDSFPLGVSNQITDNQCEIEFEDGTLAVFLSRD